MAGEIGDTLPFVGIGADNVVPVNAEPAATPEVAGADALVFTRRRGNPAVEPAAVIKWRRDEAFKAAESGRYLARDVRINV